MADALCWLLASRFQILDLIELEQKGRENPALAECLPGTLQFLTDLCHVLAARAAGEVTRICSDLVFGYNRHPSWDAPGQRAYEAETLEALEGVMPGMEACARAMGDVIEPDGSHAEKAGPCVRFAGMETFTSMRTKICGCGTGAALARDRAAASLSAVSIPEALDYPS